MTELQSGLNTPTSIVENPFIKFRKKYENGETVVKSSLKAPPMVLKNMELVKRKL